MMTMMMIMMMIAQSAFSTAAIPSTVSADVQLCHRIPTFKWR